MCLTNNSQGNKNWSTVSPNDTYNSWKYSMTTEPVQTNWNLWICCGVRSLINTQIHIASLHVCMLMHISKTQDLSYKGTRGLWSVCRLLSGDFLVPWCHRVWETWLLNGKTFPHFKVSDWIFEMCSISILFIYLWSLTSPYEYIGWSKGLPPSSIWKCDLKKRLG